MIPRETQEVQRIRQAYQAYRDEGRAERLWSVANPGYRALLREREEAMRAMLATHGYLPLAGKRILDVGCGAGGELARLLAWGAEAAHLYGVDLLPERIETARAAHPELTFSCSDAETLDFPGGSMDLVILFTVLSSIRDPAMAGNLSAEVARVLRPGGAVLFYDFRFNNPCNPHVRRVTRRRLSRLFPAAEMDLRRITLLPPLARRLGRWAETLYPVFSRLPLLCTHYLGVLIKPAGKAVTGGSGQRKPGEAPDTKQEGKMP